jgi:hypothetical protein
MSQMSIGYDIKFNNGLIVPINTITSNHVISATSGTNSSNDYIISVNTQNAITITLPSDSSLVNGRTYIINSVVENPNVTISGGTISGSTSVTLTGSYNSIQIIYNSSLNSWIVI